MYKCEREDQIKGGGRKRIQTLLSASSSTSPPLPAQSTLYDTRSLPGSIPPISLRPRYSTSFLKGLIPPLILTCLPRPFPCLRPLYRVLIGKRRGVLFYTTLLQSQYTVSDTTNVPMPDTTTGETPPTPMEISPTPFSQLVEDYVNLDASFADPGRLSAPEIQPSDYSTEPLDTPAFDGSMFNHYHDLLHFLHDQLSEYFSSVQDPALAQNFFLTFIVGPPDHINARPCLHSHIIGCHVPRLRTVIRFCLYPSVQRVSGTTLFWAPLFVYLLVTSLFPDLPLSRLYSWTPTSLLRCAPCSLHPLCSTLLVALLSLRLFLLLGICRSR